MMRNEIRLRQSEVGEKRLEKRERRERREGDRK